MGTIIFLAEHATSNVGQLNGQSVSVLLEPLAPNEVSDVRFKTRKKCIGY